MATELRRILCIDDYPDILEVARICLAMLGGILVIFMTARVQPREIENYLSLGAAAVIAKPFDPLQIASEISAIWHKAQFSQAAGQHRSVDTNHPCPSDRSQAQWRNLPAGYF